MKNGIQLSWYNSALRQYLAECEHEKIIDILACCHGNILLQLSNYPCLVQYNQIFKRHIHLSESVVASTMRPVIGDFTQIPLTDGCADVCLLHYALAEVTRAHAVIRECARVTAADGHIVVCNFNPLSLWGARQLVRPFGPFTTRTCSVRLARLTDWLTLLNFKIVSITSFAYIPPINHHCIVQCFQPIDRLLTRYWPWGGAAYILHAVKHTPASLVVRPRWRVKRMPAAVLIRPSASVKYE